MAAAVLERRAIVAPVTALCFVTDHVLLAARGPYLLVHNFSRPAQSSAQQPTQTFKVMHMHSASN
jgi:hypothetical protein